MTVSGEVLAVGEPGEVETRSGERSLSECTIRTDEGRARVSLWGSWAETAELLETGMTLALVDPAREEGPDGPRFSTTPGTHVVVEPGYLVRVTDVRQWVQCPRLYYLNKLSGADLSYPMVRGTIVHEVFGDLLRGRDLEPAVEDRVAEAGLDLGLLERDAETVREEVRAHAGAIEGWLAQGTLTGEDGWRSEQLLISETYGLRGRADGVRRGMPVELKTGKNTRREPRFHDKVQAACYALLLQERGVPADTGILLYTRNADLDRETENGDLSPAKEFSIGSGLLEFVIRSRNELAAMEFDAGVPTGYEADADCDRCFEQDTCMVVSGRLAQESKAGQIGHPVPPEERAYLETYYRAIERERGAIHAEYRKLWEQSPAERAADDRALIDLEPVERRERAAGDWELRARRTTSAVSKLREGDLVLASDGDPIGGHAELAWIERLTDEEVVLRADEPVAFTRIDTYPSDVTQSRLLTALSDAILRGDSRRKDVLFGRAEPSFEPVAETFVDNNAAQNEAVRLAVGADDCALIHGPPGAGKTFTIARTVRALVERGERVLLSAFTNRAVDNALEAVLDAGVDPDDVVRIGSESGVREDMAHLRLRSRGEPRERAGELEDARVVAATTAACGSRTLRTCAFDVALVDEASQLTEPGTLAAITLADRFVLVGDHHQLPPVVRTAGPLADVPEASPVDGDLSRSLFERLVERYPDASVLLDRQYRMAQRIQAFSSRAHYDGQLRPATPEVAGRSLADLDGVDPAALPDGLDDRVVFRAVEGTPDAHTDAEEAAAVARLVEGLVDAGVDPEDVGVIAPFRAQVATIAPRVPEAVAVDTVDRFQGSAKEVVVVSFVATGELEGPIFEDERRINVALTRAKRLLVLVGDPAALADESHYARMLEWARTGR